MPRNLEYLIAAYGIVSITVIIYTVIITSKLHTLKKKLGRLKTLELNEEK